MQDNRKKEIRIKADFIRGNCRVGRYGIIDLFRECTRLGYKLLRYPLGQNADLGFSLKKDEDIIIFTNTCARLSREIFTLAHEIGHAVLHLNEGDSFVDDCVTIAGREDMNEREQEANYFAACLLMPADDVAKYIDFEVQDFEKNGLSAVDIAGMMSEFGVSFDMALNRLESLNIISSDQKLYLDCQKVERKVGNLLKSVGGNPRLNSPSNEIDMPYEFIDYAIYNFNHNAVPKETLERVLAYYRLSMEDVSDKLKPDDFKKRDDEDLDALIGGLED